MSHQTPSVSQSGHLSISTRRLLAKAERGIPAGKNWERELYAQLRQADAVVFIASEESVLFRWCFAELALARSLRRPVFPIRVDDDAELDLLRNEQWTDLDDPNLVVRLEAGFAAAGLDDTNSFTRDRTRSPYPGLMPFSEQDAAVFFGRVSETTKLIDLLQPTLQRGTGRFIAIVGPSGSGKSSLLQAGLLPRLDRQDRRWVRLPTLRPDRRSATSPLDLLARGLSRRFEERGWSRTAEEILTVLRATPEGMVSLCAELAQQDPEDLEQPGVLLPINQAEELLASRTGGSALIEVLAGSFDEGSPLWVVATLRSEFLTGAPDRAGLAEIIDDTLLVEPLGPSRLVDVIVKPAGRAGLELADGLAQQMVLDTAGGDALPLLAYTLREMAERVGAERLITVEDYEAVGKVDGALQRRADQLYADLRRYHHGARVLTTLLKLVDVGQDNELTGRRCPLDELDEHERAVIQAFVDARLLVERHEVDEGWVEVAHLALLRQWPPLRDEIDKDRAHLHLRSNLERDAEYWAQNGRTDDYLLLGSRLGVVDEWATAHKVELQVLSREFLDASREQYTRRLREAEQTNRHLSELRDGLVASNEELSRTRDGLVASNEELSRTRDGLVASNEKLSRTSRRLIGALVATLLLIAGVVYTAHGQRTQTQLAWSRQFASQADRLVGTQPDVAILAGLQSLSMNDAKETSDGLMSGLARTVHPSRLLRGHTGPVVSVSFTPDGALMATAGTDGTVRLWDTATGTPHGTPFAGINVVEFSPDGRLVATASADHTLRLWDVATGQPHGPPLVGHTALVTGAAFSPDGTLVAGSSNDGSVLLWDIATGRAHGAPLPGYTPVDAVAFSPDGRLLATAGVDRAVRLWDVATGQPHGVPLSGQGEEVTSVAFSRDGRLLASTSGDGTTWLWDLTSEPPRSRVVAEGRSDWLNTGAFSPDGTLLATGGNDQSIRLWDVATGLPHGVAINGHTDRVDDVRFSPDGRLLASVSADQTVRLWDVSETYSVSRPLIGHRGMVDGVAFSPDGSLLVTASVDKTLQFWTVATGRPRGEPLGGQGDWVTAVAFSPDGRLLASGGRNGTVLFRDVATGRPRERAPAGHPLTVSAVAFSPDGTLLATASTDETIRLWNVETGQPLGPPLKGHAGAVNGVAFSPDGRLLASAGFDRTVRLWDVTTGQPVHPPMTGHTNQTNSVAFSRDGRLLASAGEDRTVRLWDVATGQPHGEPLIGHTDRVSAVAFSPVNDTLASASGDTSVRLWDVGTGRSTSVTGHAGWVRTLAFGPTGTLATGSGDGTARLWDLQFTAWKTVGCALVNRNLSIDEWNQIAYGLDYERTCPDLPAGPGAPPNAGSAHYPSSVR